MNEILIDEISNGSERVEKRGTKYPSIVVRLTGEDRKAFTMLCTVKRALRDAGVSKEERTQFWHEAISGDYKNLLRVCMAWVTIE